LRTTFFSLDRPALIDIFLTLEAELGETFVRAYHTVANPVPCASLEPLSVAFQHMAVTDVDSAYLQQLHPYWASLLMHCLPAKEAIQCPLAHPAMTLWVNLMLTIMTRVRVVGLDAWAQLDQRPSEHSRHGACMGVLYLLCVLRKVLE